MNDQTIEQEIVDKGLTAPRVTTADIEANIAGEYYFSAMDGVLGKAISFSHISPHPVNGNDPAFYELSHPLNTLTFCILVLKNGFTVTGESACASPKNFDAELGRKMARQNAINKIWPLMGYELKQRLHTGV
jgi:hypothetical protein